MSIQIPYLISAFFAGICFAGFYFGGLWWTVRRLPAARHPALWSVASFYVRTATTLLGFYLIMGGRWERLVVGLMGFMMVRQVMIRRIRPQRTVGSRE